MRMNLCFMLQQSDVANLKALTAHFKYSSHSLFNGNPSRNAGSSTWIILMPACSKASTS